MRRIIAKLLIWALGGESAVDKRLWEIRATFQHQIAEGLMKDQVICWQATMVQRYEQTEPDLLRRIRLQDLALAMIDETDRMHPHPDPAVRELRERMSASLRGVGDMIAKQIQ